MRNAILTFMVLAALGLALPAFSATAEPVSPSNDPGGEEATPPVPQDIDARAIWTTQTFCSINHAAEVQGYRIVCTGATFLDTQIADGGIAGDHWQMKLRSYDTNLNSAVTTAPGGVGTFGVRGRVYNRSGTPQNPGGLIAYAECTYPHGGINVFPAGAFVSFSSDGTCTVAADPLRARIDRSP